MSEPPSDIVHPGFGGFNIPLFQLLGLLGEGVQDHDLLPHYREIEEPVFRPSPFRPYLPLDDNQQSDSGYDSGEGQKRLSGFPIHFNSPFSNASIK